MYTFTCVQYLLNLQNKPFFLVKHFESHTSVDAFDFFCNCTLKFITVFFNYIIFNEILSNDTVQVQVIAIWQNTQFYNTFKHLIVKKITVITQQARTTAKKTCYVRPICTYTSQLYLFCLVFTKNGTEVGNQFPIYQMICQHQ